MPPPPLPSRQVSWASSPHQLLVLRLYVPLESHIIWFLCRIHDNGDNNPTSGHGRDVCSVWPETNTDILLLLNNVNILKSSNNVNIVPGDQISAAHQYQCLLVWWPPRCVVIMSYHVISHDPCHVHCHITPMCHLSSWHITLKMEHVPA